MSRRHLINSSDVFVIKGFTVFTQKRGFKESHDFKGGGGKRLRGWLTGTLQRKNKTSQDIYMFFFTFPCCNQLNTAKLMADMFLLDLTSQTSDQQLGYIISFFSKHSTSHIGKDVTCRRRFSNAYLQCLIGDILVKVQWNRYSVLMKKHSFPLAKRNNVVKGSVCEKWKEV